jgi:hypothetical protein
MDQIMYTQEKIDNARSLMGNPEILHFGSELWIYMHEVANHMHICAFSWTI